MNGWRRIRDAVILGVIWAVVWAPIAIVVGTTIIDPDNSMDEMWVAIGAYPGFLCALIFSGLLAVAERNRTLRELPVSRAATWGALAGIIVGGFPFFVGSSTTKLPLWQLGVLVVGSIALMSAISAAVSVLATRMLRKRQLA